jgi:DNA polymerase III subunit delta'
MTDETDDPRESVIHPRRRAVLYGHERAERRIIDAWSAGRLHHAFLIAGPQGIGKATFAYRVARFLLRHPDPAAAAQPESLEIPETDMVARLVAARSHPDLAVVEPRFDDRTKRIKREIAADDARVPSAFFALTAGLGGYRVVIVDAADNLNKTSANALLKILEEPPPRAIFLIVSHAPGNLLPTIRSRCIRLDLSPLETASVERVLGEIVGEPGDAELTRQAAELSRGSPGRALELLNAHVTGHFSRFRKLFAAGPPFNRKDALEIAAAVSGRGNEGDEGWDMFCWLLTDWLTAHARALALAGADSAPAFAAAHEEITGSLHRTNALNLDRRQTILEAFRAVEQAAGPRPTAS